MPWAGGDLFTNPTAGTVLVDTGQIASRHNCTPLLVIWASVGIEVVFEHRNADNAGTIKDQVLPVTLSILVLQLKGIALERNERLRIVTRSDVAGECEASIFYP